MPVPPGRKVSILLALVLFVSPAQALVHPTLFSTSLLRGNSHFRNIDSPVQHPNAQQARLVRSSAQSAVVSSSSPAGRGYFSVCRSTLSTRHASPSVDISTRQSHGGGSEEPLSRSEALSTLFDGMGCAIAVTLAGTSRARADGADGLGVVDDLLADCPSTPTCVSSQDDRPYSFMEPWSYEGTWERAMKRLQSYVEFHGAKVIASSPRYLRVEFESAQVISSSVDDAEFYFTPDDALVQFRCARRNGPTDLGANRRRMDSIRLALNFESIPVLRNRKRAFFFGESPVDSFGPSFGKVDPSVIYGDTDPMSPPFETPSGELRDRYGGGGGGHDKPTWWGTPLAKAGGFADWRPPRWA